MCQAEKGPELAAPAAPDASEPETELLAEAKAAGLFLDRELSWLQFNRRVLEQAGDPTVPLLERLKFLGIYRSNLEEFFMVRVGSLTHRAALLPDERDEKTGCTPGEQVSAILAAVAAQQPRADVDKLAELACSFHRYICFKSGNNVVPLIVNGFHDVNIVLWAQWVRSVGPRAAGDVLEDFLYFVTQGDAEGAIALFDTNTDEFVSRLVDV